MTRSDGQIAVTRFHGPDGEPTCCIKWGSAHDTCPLLRTNHCGLVEVCAWDDSILERRGIDGQATGLLIPGQGCPVHPTNKDAT